MHTGDVVAGVIGVKKFVYDVWGDTVNTASRMESHGTPGMIHVSGAVRERLRDAFVFEPRGQIDVKGKGPMTTFYLLGEVGKCDPANLPRRGLPTGEDGAGAGSGGEGEEGEEGGESPAPLSPILSRTLSRLSSSVASAAAFFGRRNSSTL
eukprot:tig00021037_g17415.t1